MKSSARYKVVQRGVNEVEVWKVDFAAQATNYLKSGVTQIHVSCE